MKRYGVIDLGTNTFHLLIVAARPDGGFEELYRNRYFIKMAEQGIQTIGPAPFERGLQAIRDFRNMLDLHGVSDVRAFGTAALRTASNGKDFIDEVQQISGIEVTIIPGSEEARLIHKGVSQAVPLQESRSLIMDIGGGSVEFIIADGHQMYWAQSFPVGVAVLHRDFHHNDPITTDEINKLEQYLSFQLQPLLVALTQYPAQILIGASGTFDAIEQALIPHRPNLLHSSLDVETFYPYYHDVVATTLQERFAREDIPDSRADMIVVALVLIRFIIEKAEINQIIISAYAMKEGILHEMMHPA